MDRNLLDILICPECQSDLHFDILRFYCSSCVRTFNFNQGIPKFFIADTTTRSKNDILGKVKSHYEKTPFPDYSEFEDVGNLIDKASKSILIKSLNDQIPFEAKILEVGCGTGQLSNYLSTDHRMVVGTDISMNSLMLAQAFKNKFNLSHSNHFQMNVFRPCFRPASFHVTISNGVLHHTTDPKEGLKVLATLTKKGGYVVLGLYHRFGRLITDIRRSIFRYCGDGLSFLDSRMSQLGDKQRNAWFLDQYRNPHESKHTIQEVCGWLEEFDLNFIRSIPSNYFGPHINSDTRLFQKDRAVKLFESTLAELSFSLRPSQIKEGGFFVVIAKKN